MRDTGDGRGYTRAARADRGAMSGQGPDDRRPEKDNEGCLVVDKRQKTSIDGLYAAGDVTTNSNKFKQTIMSAAEGCLAANSIHEDILRSH